MWDGIYWTSVIAGAAVGGGFAILLTGAGIFSVADWARYRWIHRNGRTSAVRNVPPPAPIVNVGGSRSFADTVAELRAPRGITTSDYRDESRPTTDEILTQMETALRDSVVLGTNHAREQEEAMRDTGSLHHGRYEPIAPVGVYVGEAPYVNYGSWMEHQRQQQHTATYNGMQILIQSVETSISAGSAMEIKLRGILVPPTTPPTQHPSAPAALGDRHPIAPEQEEATQQTARQLRGIRIRENG